MNIMQTNNKHPERRCPTLSVGFCLREQKITEVWQYANQLWDSLRWVHSLNMDAIRWVVVEIMSMNQSTNQRPAFGKNSLECDSTLMKSEGLLGEFTFVIWKQYDVWLWGEWSEMYWLISSRHLVEKSLELDSMLIRSGDHIDFRIPIWKQYNEWLQR